MPQTKHKYRVSLYLGKDLYERFEQEAQFMGISVATFTKIILTTGYEFAKGLESEMIEKKGGKKGNGE